MGACCDECAEAAELEIAVKRGRLDWSPRVNWVERQGGLPDYMERIAVHLIEKGYSREHAIAVAINTCKRWCRTGRNNFRRRGRINSGSRAQACAAVAQWEAMRARARAQHGRRRR